MDIKDILALEAGEQANIARAMAKLANSIDEETVRAFMEKQDRERVLKHEEITYGLVQPKLKEFLKEMGVTHEEFVTKHHNHFKNMLSEASKRTGRYLGKLAKAKILSKTDMTEPSKTGSEKGRRYSAYSILYVRGETAANTPATKQPRPLIISKAAKAEMSEHKKRLFASGVADKLDRGDPGRFHSITTGIREVDLREYMHDEPEQNTARKIAIRLLTARLKEIFDREKTLLEAAQKHGLKEHRHDPEKILYGTTLDRAKADVASKLKSMKNEGLIHRTDVEGIAPKSGGRTEICYYKKKMEAK